MNIWRPKSVWTIFDVCGQDRRESGEVGSGFARNFHLCERGGDGLSSERLNRRLERFSQDDGASGAIDLEITRGGCNSRW